ncbi:MAG: hypothetical protein AAFP77_16125 [Bacteroidota bacterium]
MGARLQGYFRSEKGERYRVTLDVDGYSGPVDDFKLSELKISHKGDTNDIHHPILSSSARLSFVIANSTIQSVFSGLTGAAEEEYRIRIDKGLSDELHWAGFVIPDQVVIEDAPYPFNFSAEAVDGIGRLKDKDYTGTGEDWEEWTTDLQHLYNILSFIPLADFWGPSDVYLKARNQIFEDAHAEGEAVSPLPITRVNHRVFRKVNSSGHVEYMTAYQVLAEFCRAHASRFYFSDGVYHFEQLTEYANQDTTITFKQWDTSGGALADEALNDWDTRLLVVDRSALRQAGSADLTVATGAVGTFLSAVSKVELTYKHFKTRSILSHIFPPPTWDQSSAVEINTGSVDDNSGATRLLVTADVTFNISFAVPDDVEPGRLKMRCLLKLEGGSTHYCRRQATIDLGVVSYEEPIWTTDISYVEFYTDTHNGNGLDYLYRFVLYAPNLPESGDLSIDFDFVELAGMTGIIGIGAGYTSNWNISNVYGEVYSDGSVDAPSDSRLYRSFNNNDTNSDVLDPEVILGDGPTGTAFGRIQVFDGTTWVDSANWKLRGEADLLPHGARIAQEIITPRLEPAERLEGALLDTFMAHNIITRSNTRYIFMQGTIDLSRNEVDGVWVAITDSATLATTPDTGIDLDIGSTNPIPPGPSFPPGPYAPQVPATGWQGGLVDIGGLRGSIDNNVVFTLSSALLVDDGDVTFLSVQERDFIHNLFNEDEIEVVNPYNGRAQTFVVDTNQESDKTINVITQTPIIDFPVGSWVTPKRNFLFRLISRLRRKTVTVQLVPSHLEIIGDPALMPLQFDTFFRVPEWMNGYKLAKWTVSVHTAGTGTGFVNVNVTAAGVSNALTFDYINEQETKTLTTYQALSTGDLITFHLTNITDGTGNRPLGLTVDLQLIAML